MHRISSRLLAKRFKFIKNSSSLNPESLSFPRSLPKATASYLSKMQKVYKDTLFSQTIRIFISYFLKKKNLESYQFSENLQSVIERISCQMIVSEIEFICFCIYFDEISDQVKGIPLMELLHLAFFLIKSKVESDSTLIDSIRSYLKFLYPSLLEKAQKVENFTIDVFKLNRVFSEYKRQRKFHLNYWNYVDNICRSSLPYNCKKRSKKYRRCSQKLKKKRKSYTDEEIKPAIIDKNEGENDLSNNEIKFKTLIHDTKSNDEYYNMREFEPII